MNDDSVLSADERLRLLVGAVDLLGGDAQLADNLALNVEHIGIYRKHPEQIPRWIAIACRQIVARVARQPRGLST